ncbi:MAG TPA: PQQ-binding-like beta-propeller repeat protein [Hyphomonadaceae bacterium]|jgi:polyvinyl alcohol dehydrogenase (cytochrome)|nr:PQQ-binding-like beta-propeller repeat protein [Hyphomonadaceae bacterium]
MKLRHSLRSFALVSSFALAAAACTTDTPTTTTASAAPAAAPVAAAPAPVAPPAAPTQPVAAQQGAAHPGRAVYVKSCSTCHDNPGGSRAATFASLQTTPAPRLREVLTTGVMAPMAAGLSPTELNDLIGYLTIGQAAPAPQAASWTEAAMCAADKRTVDISKPVSFGGFGGPDLKGARSLTSAQAGLKKADMANLEVAWTLGFPQTNAMGTGAAILGDTAFISAGGRMLAIDTGSGCIKWAYTASSRNTPTIGEIGGKKVLAFAAGRGEVHVVDAATGALVWKADGRPASGRLGIGIRGGVTIYKDKIFVPISDSGIGGQGPNGECCDGHGVVVALSAADGKRVWEYHTMPDAQYTGEVNPKGAKVKGPSGAPIWSVPMIDEKRNRVIVTTGENTSHPGTDTSDSVIALDIATGKEAWKFQAMALDVWNMQCKTSKADSGPTCPWNTPSDTGVGRDYDFGAGAVLGSVGGKDVIFAGQKSGDVWALDADTGKKIWNSKVSQGTALGGVHWGITTDGARVFAPINDPVIDGQTKFRPGFFALDAKTGKQVWGYDAKADCAGDRGKAVAGCDTKFGFSVAPVVVDGTVLAGTLDGKFFVFDSATGKIIKQFDFIGPQKTVNGVAGKGGSLDSHAISVGNGTILVGAGYASFGQTGGNVLVALKPKK